jgi:polyisoprenoid-binding protein YceI
MKPRCSLSCAFALGVMIAGHAAVAAPVVFTLEPAHSFVQFEVLHFGTSTARGRFGPVAGQVTLDREARSGSARIEIDIAGVSTGLRVFDARIRRGDLLASADFPQAVFSAESFRFEGDRLAEVSGTLSLRGVSRPFVLRALRFGCEARAGREVCGGDFEGDLLRSEFGIDYLIPLVADRVRLRVQVEGGAR